MGLLTLHVAHTGLIAVRDADPGAPTIVAHATCRRVSGGTVQDSKFPKPEGQSTFTQLIKF